MASKNYTT
jgi:phosphatidate cytidylyltransferase